MSPLQTRAPLPVFHQYDYYGGARANEISAFLALIVAEQQYRYLRSYF